MQEIKVEKLEKEGMREKERQERWEVQERKWKRPRKERMREEERQERWELQEMKMESRLEISNVRRIGRRYEKAAEKETKDNIRSGSSRRDENEREGRKEECRKEAEDGIRKR